jgi:hypothetical protein
MWIEKDVEKSCGEMKFRGKELPVAGVRVVEFVVALVVRNTGKSL